MLVDDVRTNFQCGGSDPKKVYRCCKVARCLSARWCKRSRHSLHYLVMNATASQATMQPTFETWVLSGTWAVLAPTTRPCQPSATLSVGCSHA